MNIEENWIKSQELTWIVNIIYELSSEVPPVQYSFVLNHWQ